jgi:hypothetical protein
VGRHAANQWLCSGMKAILLNNGGAVSTRGTDCS